MPVPDIIRQIESDPDFAKLTYREQTSIRADAWANILSKDPDFAALDPDARQRQLSNFIFSPPKFQDYPDDISGVNWQEDVERLAAGWHSQDPREHNRAARQMRHIIGEFSMNTQLRPNTAIARFIQRHARQAGLIRREHAEERSAPRGPMAKAVEYFDLLMSQDRREMAKARVARQLGRWGGIATEIGSMWMIAASPGVAAARAAALARVGARAAQAGTTSGRFLWGSIAPNLVRAGGSAAMGATISLTNDILSTDEIGAQEVFANAARNGLEWALGDIAVMGAWQGIGKPVLGGLGSVFGNAVRRGGWSGNVARQAIDDFAAGAKRMLEGVDIPDHILARLPQEAKDSLHRMGRAFRTLRDPERLFGNEYEALGLAAATVGREASRSGKRIVIKDLIGDTKPQRFATINDAADYLNTVADDMLPKAKPDPQAISAAAQGQAKVTQLTKMKGLSATDVSADEVLARTINPPGGVVVPQNIRTFARVFVDKLGGNGEQFVSNARFQTTQNYFSRTADELAEANTIQIPKTINTPGQAEKFARQLTQVITERVGPSIPRSADEVRSAAREIVDRIPRTVVEKNIYSPVWTRQMWKRLTKGGDLMDRPGGGVQIRHPNGQLGRTFNDINEAGRMAFNQSMDAGAAAHHLADRFGFRLVTKQLDDGSVLYSVKTGKGDALVTDAKSLGEIWDTMPELRPDFPVETAPEIVFVSPNEVEVTLREGMPTGNIQDSLRYLSQFRNYTGRNFESMVRIGDGTMKFDRMSRRYIVEVPEIGHVKRLRSQQEAREYLAGGWKQWDNILDVAEEKGYHVVPFRGQFLAYPHGSSVAQVARNSEELYRIMGATPTPVTAKEISGASDELLSSFDDVPIETVSQPNMNFVPGDGPLDDISDLKRSKEIGLVTEGLMTVGPVDAVFRRISRELEVPELFEQFQNVQASLQASASQVNQMVPLVENIFSHRGGKVFAPKRRRLMGDVFLDNTDPESWATRAQHYGDQLTEEELQAMRRFREFLVDNEAGLATRFGADPLRFYQSLGIIRRWIKDHPRRLYFDSDSMDFLKTALPALPEDLRVWAQGSRLSDILQYVYKRDLMELAHGHLAGLFKKELVGGAWQDSVNWLNTVTRTRRTFQRTGELPEGIDRPLAEAAARLDTPAIERFDLYLKDIMRIPTTQSEAWLRRTSLKFSRALSDKFSRSEFFKKFGLDDRVLTTDILSSAMAMSAGASMGFRPWIIVRNMMQPFTTLAPRVGNTTVWRAIGRMGKEGDEIVERMLQRGIITGNIPVYGMDVDGLRRNLTNKGLAAFKNSDVWDRGIGFAVADDLIRDSWGRYTRGVLGTGDEAVEKFMNLSELRHAPPEIRDEVFKQLQAGSIEGAVDQYAKNLIDESFFPYQQATNPLAFRGVMGRLFGQFGHFPVYYTANLVRQFARRSPAEKALFLGRWFGNLGALYFGLQAMGINGGYNFMPWSSIVFSGGPYFDLMVNALRTTSPGIGGRLARREMARSWMLLVPGSYAARSGLRAMRAMDNGDYYSASLAFLSAPVLPEHQQAQFD